VIEAIQDEVFPLGRLLDSLPFTGFGGCNVLEPHAAGRFGGGVFGGEVLTREQRVLLDEVRQDVIAHPPFPLRMADARPIQRLHDGPRHGLIDNGAAERRDAGRFVPQQSGDNAWRLIERQPDADAHALALRQLDADGGIGAEDQRFHVRPPDLIERLLALQQVAQLTRLAVGQDQRAVDSKDAPFLLPKPGLPVAGCEDVELATATADQANLKRAIAQAVQEAILNATQS